MRFVLTAFWLFVVMVTGTACGDDGKLSPKESVDVGCRTFVDIADAREATRVEKRQAMDSARTALSSGSTAAKLRTLSAAEDDALKAEHEYAQTPDVSIVAIGFAADADDTYQPLLTAFLSGDVSKAKDACSRFEAEG